MKEMQFSIIVLTTLMCAVLVFQMPGRVKRDEVSNRSRWLMCGSLALIGVQFLIQYITELRALGITQAEIDGFRRQGEQIIWIDTDYGEVNHALHRSCLSPAL